MSARPTTTLLLTLFAALQLALQPLAAGRVCLMGRVADAACCDEPSAPTPTCCAGEAEDADEADDAAGHGGCECEWRSQDEPRVPAHAPEPGPQVDAPLVGASPVSAPVAALAPGRLARRIDVRPPGTGPPRHLLFGVLLI